MVVLRPIFDHHHTHSQLTHMKFPKCFKAVSLDRVVLRPIFGTSTTHKLSEVL